MRTGGSILGIHIEDQFLNLVSLRRTAKGLTVCGSAVEPLDEKEVQNGRVVSEKVIAQKIHSFAKAHKIRAHQVVMSPSCAAVVLKSSEYVTKSDTQTKKQVSEKIQKYTVFGSEEIVFDYCRADEGSEVSDKQTVLEAISTQQTSDAFITIAQKARLKLMRIEPAVLPLIKLVYGGVAEESRGVSLLLTLESNAGTISVFEKKVPRLCQNLNLGINDIMENVDGPDRLTGQLKTVLEYARSLSASASSGILMRVAASGPSERSQEVAAKLERTLSGVTVKTVTGKDFVDFYNIDASRSQDPPVFALAGALAAFDVSSFSGQLDLVSQKSLVICKTQREMSLTAKAMVAIVVLALAARVPFKMEMGAVEAAAVGIENTNADQMKMQDKIAFLTGQVEGLKKKQAAYTQATESHAVIPWHQILEGIGNLVPETVRITSIASTGQGHFRIKGEAWIESDIRRFHKLLKDSEPVKTAKLESINYAEKESYVIVTYEIICQAHSEETNL